MPFDKIPTREAQEIRHETSGRENKQAAGQQNQTARRNALADQKKPNPELRVGKMRTSEIYPADILKGSESGNT